jgi:hypothetical protein
LFSVASGALAERFDPRRVIQIGMVLFIIVSLSWSYFFRQFADVAGDGDPRHPWLRRRAVADAQPDAALRHLAAHDIQPSKRRIENARSVPTPARAL